MPVCQTALNVPIWWSVDSQENNWNCCQLATRSHILKLQFNAPNSILGWGSAPDPTGPLGELTEAKKERKGRERKGEGKEREAGPSPPIPNSLRHWVRRALRGVRDSGLWVTWPGLRIFWPRNDLAPLLRWRRHWWNPPQTPIFGAWIGVFKPNVQNIESYILSKLHRFQLNFAQR